MSSSGSRVGARRTTKIQTSQNFLYWGSLGFKGFDDIKCKHGLNLRAHTIMGPLSTITVVGEIIYSSGFKRTAINKHGIRVGLAPLLDSFKF